MAAQQCEAKTQTGQRCSRVAVKEGLCIQHAQRAGIWRPEDNRNAYIVSEDGTVIAWAECVKVFLTDEQAEDLLDNYADSDRQAIAIRMNARPSPYVTG